MRTLLKLLGAFWTLKAFGKGPGHLVRREARRTAYRAVRRHL